MAGSVCARVRIADLLPSASKVVVVGLVIAKISPRSVIGSRGDQRHVLNFTLRDSPDDTINCSCWGSHPYVISTSDLFNIGDVVEITNPQVNACKSTDDKYNPRASSKCQLNLNEPLTTLAKHVGPIQKFNLLMNVPLIDGPITQLATLPTLVDHDPRHGELSVNLMVAVKKIGDVIEGTSRAAGKPFSKCSVTVFDESLSNFIIDIWDLEMIKFAQKWTEYETIILVQGIAVGFDNFRRCVTAKTNRKTVITLSPHIPEYRSFSSFLMTVPTDTQLDGEISIDNIHDVYTISEIRAISSELKQGYKAAGIVYAHLTSFDLDGLTTIYTSQCSTCKNKLDPVHGQCNNVTCAAGAGEQMVSPMDQWDMAIEVSDSTGSMSTRLRGDVANQLLEYNVEEFIHLEPYQKTAIKWKHLLEPMKLFIKVGQNFEQKMSANVLRVESVDAEEICKQLARKK